MGRYTPWDQVHPQNQVHPPGQVHPLGSSTPQAVHAGRYGQQAGSTHPTGMHSCYTYNSTICVYQSKSHTNLQTARQRMTRFVRDVNRI